MLIMNTIRNFLKSSGGYTQASQTSLVNHLVNRGALHSNKITRVMQMVDRKHFVAQPTSDLAKIYQDTPLPIGAGQTISAPHMHAIALELLRDRLQPGARVLDVGSGSGYLTACMALLVQPGGWVLGVEKVPELAERSITSIRAASETLQADTSCWAIRTGNVLEEELDCLGPFAAIHVGAAADELHQQLVDALAPGGRMVIPLGPRWGTQMLLAVDKDAAGEVHCQRLMEVGYVPLVRPSEMENGYEG